MYVSLALVLALLYTLRSGRSLKYSFVSPRVNSRSCNILETRALTGPTKIYRTGSIVEFRGGSTFLVQLDSSSKRVLCDLGGRCIKRRIRVDINTKVKVEFDLIHPTRGRIVERLSAKIPKVKVEEKKKEEEIEEEEDDYDYEEEE
ncbi:conserved hypothetical protein [Theileria equi strain WA]|uniref:Uncharacterized protein n=1 Tax=Theileria equi strain WA TaxID=1537102 RepID=L1LA15_THEEQ|nr:conserved hypothetical protein [Theileria equi strain WA]EKX72065.1 conserved hypothetical protein [Theileria equi strain WA]|eukprot:XP_004831517.1 conserved hypothetical protein [Theileria equi strain WA]